MYLNELEKELHTLLVTVGCIHRTQIYYYFVRADRELRRDVVDGVILSLEKKHLAYTSDKQFYTVNIHKKVDPYMIDAIWILLQSKNDIEWNTVMLADNPSQLLYVKNGQLYEIISIKDNEEYKYISLNKKHLSNSSTTMQKEDAIDESIKYIIVVPHESYINNIPNVQLKYVIAVIDYFKNDDLLDLPNFRFF